MRGQRGQRAWTLLSPQFILLAYRCREYTRSRCDRQWQTWYPLPGIPQTRDCRRWRVGLIVKVALGVILAVVAMTFLFQARVTVKPAQTTTLSTDARLCDDGYRPSCRAIGR